MRNRLPTPRPDVLDIRPTARRFTEEALAALVYGIRQNRHLNAKVHSAIALLSWGWGRPESGCGVIPFDDATPDEVRAVTSRTLEDFAAKGYTIIDADGKVVLGLKPYNPDAVITDEESDEPDSLIKNPHVGEEETDTQPRGSPVAPPGFAPRRCG